NPMRDQLCSQNLYPQLCDLRVSVVNPFFGSAGFKACWLSFDTAREELRNPPERILVDRPRQDKTEPRSRMRRDQADIAQFLDQLARCLKTNLWQKPVI